MFCLGLGDLWASGLSPAYPIPVPDRVTPTYEGWRREPERPRPSLPAAREPARGARARPPLPAGRPAQRHAPALPRLPDAQGSIPAAPGGPDRAALTSHPAPLALRVETATMFCRGSTMMAERGPSA